jgi:ribosomal protein S6--L-glutamate ligase
LQCRNTEQAAEVLLQGVPVRIGVILDWTNPVIAETFRVLSDRGVKLDLLRPEKQMIDLAKLRVENDLYILKSGTELALSVAGALHALGAATLNPYPTVAMMRNKIIVTRMLKEAGLPTPDTYVSSDPSDFRPLLESGPLILKLYRGSRGAGIHIVRKPQELDGLNLDGLMLAQRYHEPDGPDCKIYCIGGRLFGIRRIWPIRTYEDKLGQPFDLGPELRDIALRCGRVFGIDLYGLDTVVSDGRPYVVDVQKFGSYMGVPDAPGVLADYIVAAGTRAMRGELQLSESA